MLKVWVDASPGEPALIAAVTEKKIRVNTVENNTNNMLEYYAVWDVIRQIKTSQHVEIFSDSQLVINQINGEWTCKEKRLQEYRDKILDYIRINKLTIKFSWVNREDNPAGRLLDKDIRGLF